MGRGIGSLTSVVPGLENVSAPTTSGVFYVESFGKFTMQILPADAGDENPTVSAEATVYGSLRRDARADRAADWAELGSFTGDDLLTAEFPVLALMVEVTDVTGDPIMVVWAGG